MSGVLCVIDFSCVEGLVWYITTVLPNSRPTKYAKSRYDSLVAV